MRTIAIAAAAGISLLGLAGWSVAQDDPSQVLQSAGQGDAVQQMLQRRARAGDQDPQMSSAREEEIRQRTDRVRAASDKLDAEMAAANATRLQCDHQCDAENRQCLSDSKPDKRVFCVLDTGQCRNRCEVNYQAATTVAQARYEAVRH